MPFLFTNPIGFLALLGIPIILLIHLLQRKSRKLPSSTLFLLDTIDRQSLRGRKIERIRSSLPLWLQLLSVIVLTWLLVEPRWSTDSTVRQVVVVLDSSASMEAFRENATEKLRSELGGIVPGGNTIYTFLESHREGERLARAESIGEALAALDQWEPAFGLHSPEPALRVGRSLAGTDGTLVYVTDHIDASLPFGAVLLSVGEPIENVGFAGATVVGPGGATKEATWQVTVRNYSDTPLSREWFLAAGGQRTSPRPLTLDPGATRILSGAFPKGSDRIALSLTADSFTRDDQMFLVVPEPKPVTLAHDVADGALPLVTDLIQSLENAPLFATTDTNEIEERQQPDLIFATYNPLSPRPLPEAGIVFVHQEAVPREFFSGPIIAANHSLVADLNWQGLIAKKTPSIPVDAEDIALVWQGERPLVFLRRTEGRNVLVFNFDVVQSNAARLPAFVLSISRFVDAVRQDKVGLERANVELRQPLQVARDLSPEAPALLLSIAGRERSVSGSRISAPGEPGFFEIRQAKQPLLSGAANFADVRESDFSKAASRSDLVAVSDEVARKVTVVDPWWRIWVIGLLFLALAVWQLLYRADHRSLETETA